MAIPPRAQPQTFPGPRLPLRLGVPPQQWGLRVLSSLRDSGNSPGLGTHGFKDALSSTSQPVLHLIIISYSRM